MTKQLSYHASDNKLICHLHFQTLSKKKNKLKLSYDQRVQSSIRSRRSSQKNLNSRFGIVLWSQWIVINLLNKTWHTLNGQFNFVYVFLVFDRCVRSLYRSNQVQQFSLSFLLVFFNSVFFLDQKFPSSPLYTSFHWIIINYLRI